MSWSLDVRVFFKEPFKHLLTPAVFPRDDFWELPFASPSMFESPIRKVILRDTTILDDATPLNPRQFAAEARAGMLFCIDPDELLIKHVAPASTFHDSFLVVRLAGVCEHFEFSFLHGDDRIDASTTDGRICDHWRLLASRYPWCSRGTDLPVVSSEDTWDDVERIAFEILAPFIGENYLEYGGDEPLVGIYQVVE